MKINISEINTEFFYINEKVIGDIPVLSIHQRPNCVWDKDNLILRASVWSKDGELISASYKKFFNWEEQPDLSSKPLSLSGCKLIEKIDGSAFIVSNFKGNLITRTRETVNIDNLPTKGEVDEFKIRYPKAFIVDECRSYIYEWVTPANRIVLDYKEPDIYLTGVIEHSDYSMWEQDKLDEFALEIGVKRPRTFEFSTIDDMIIAVKEFKGIEGVCVYFNHGQTIKKLKAIQYLTFHSFKYGMSLDNTLELFFKFGKPNYNEFMNKIAQEFDWECAEFIRGFVSRICDASVEVNKIITAMKSFADSVKHLNRKEAAEKIISAYGKTSRSGFVFNLLDNKDINEDGLKKLYFQCLK